MLHFDSREVITSREKMPVYASTKFPQLTVTFSFLFFSELINAGLKYIENEVFHNLTNLKTL